MYGLETWTMHNGVSASRVGREQCGHPWLGPWHWKRREGKRWAFNKATLALAEADDEWDMINVLKKMKSSHLAQQNHPAISIYESCLSQQPTNHGYCIVWGPWCVAFQGGKMIAHAVMSQAHDWRWWWTLQRAKELREQHGCGESNPKSNNSFATAHVSAQRNGRVENHLQGIATHRDTEQHGEVHVW